VAILHSFVYEAHLGSSLVDVYTFDYAAVIQLSPLSHQITLREERPSVIAPHTLRSVFEPSNGATYAMLFLSILLEEHHTEPQTTPLLL
jgi:hypothetical protein